MGQVIENMFISIDYKHTVLEDIRYVRVKVNVTIGQQSVPSIPL